MGKGKKKKDDDSDEEEDKKKKKKDAKKKKKDKKKDKKDKKKKKGKKESSSSSSSSSSESAGDEKKAKKAKKGDGEDAEAAEAQLLAIVPPKHSLHLPPPEEGILRFEFTADETGPLGVRFGSGFPPLILAVSSDSFAGKKGVPAAHEVHAINGLALIPQNKEVVMPCLKARPVTLDVRPQGWKPPEKAKELAKKKAAEDAEKAVRVQVELQRREQVARDKKEQQERDAAERAEREAKEAVEREEAIKHAREARAQLRAKEKEFMSIIEGDPAELRSAANTLMEAEYGSSVTKVKAIPLRLFTRRKEVAWQWAGDVMELIGGGVNEDDDSWDA
jgi:hypothetical protein